MIEISYSYTCDCCHKAIAPSMTHAARSRHGLPKPETPPGRLLDKELCLSCTRKALQELFE